MAHQIPHPSVPFQLKSISAEAWKTAKTAKTIESFPWGRCGFSREAIFLSLYTDKIESEFSGPYPNL
jgi:hypothetical protein